MSELPSLLCFDFDGTLHSSRTEPCIDPSFHQLLLELVQRGFKWGINTGRSYDFLLEGIEEASFSVTPDFLVSREREVHFWNEKLRFHEVDASWKARCDQLHREKFDEVDDFIKAVEHYVKKETKAEWVSEEGDEAGVIATSIPEMNRILRFVDADIENYADLAYLRSTVYMRFTHSEFHKGTAMDYVAKKLGVRFDRIFAIGDGENDLGMLDAKFAGMLACPANAVDQVLQRVLDHGGYVASSEVSAGVCESLEYYFKGRKG